MAQTLVGVFDNQSDAQQVAQELIGLGIDRTHVRLSSQDATTRGSSSSSDDKGFWESVKDVLGFGDDDDNDRYGLREAHRRGGTVVTVTTDDKWTDQVSDVMRRHNVINLDERAQQWKSQGWSGYDRYQPSADAGTTQMADMDVASTATAGTPMASAGMTGGTMASADMTTGATTGATHAAARTQQGAEAIPVVEEEIRVGKREVSRGGVRVVSRVTERPVEENVNLREEHVHVERHAVDRPLTAADANAAFRERTIEATETAEEAVVSKNARVVEEVVVNKDVDQRTETVRDTVRRTDVDVQRTDASADDARFRPAYEFADETSADARFRGRAFDEVETDLRSSYEQRNPGSRWDDVRDAVRSRYGRSSNKSNA